MQKGENVNHQIQCDDGDGKKGERIGIEYFLLLLLFSLMHEHSRCIMHTIFFQSLDMTM
jgi:hypothetical protein